MTFYSFWAIPVISLIATGFAIFFLISSKFTSDISEKGFAVSRGLRVYFKSSLRLTVSVGILFVMLVIVSTATLRTSVVPVTFFIGGYLLSVFLPRLSLRFNTRVAQKLASSEAGINKRLKMAYQGASISALLILAIATAAMWLLFILIRNGAESSTALSPLVLLLMVGCGIAVHTFSQRLQGGIFAKTADMTNDGVLLTKPDAAFYDGGNVAETADHVGDNVADVSGTISEYLETSFSVIIASIVIGSVAAGVSEMENATILFPILLISVGLLLGIPAIFLIRSRNWATQKNLSEAYLLVLLSSSAVMSLVAFVLAYFLGFSNFWQFGVAVTLGLLTKIGILLLSERAVSEEFKSTKLIAENTYTSTSTGFVTALGLGMRSMTIPIGLVVLGASGSFLITSQFDLQQALLGFYGIALCAVGMIMPSVLSVTSSLLGAIADNTLYFRNGGDKDRQELDAMDAFGNMSSASVKNQMVAASTMAAVALIAGYFLYIRFDLTQILGATGQFLMPDGQSLRSIDDLRSMMLWELALGLNISVLNPGFIVGLFTGSMIIIFVAGHGISGVGKEATLLIEQICYRVGSPDQKSGNEWLERMARLSVHHSILPLCVGLGLPLLMGLVFGVSSLMGYLIGSLGIGFAFSSFLANTGSALDNAKKYYKTGPPGDQQSEVQPRLQILDNIGDPMKDTAAPAVSSYMKLSVFLAILYSGIVLNYSLFG